MANPTKKHHFVPECYLNNFIKDRNLYVLNIKKVLKGFQEKVQHRYPGSICYTLDGYLIKEEYTTGNFPVNAPNNLYIEKEVFRPFENNYQTLFEKLVATDTPDMDLAVRLCDWILQLKLRNPVHLHETLEKHASSWISTSVQQLIKEGGREKRLFKFPTQVMELAISKMERDILSDPNTPTKLFLNSLLARANDPEKGNKVFREAMLQANWVLLEAPENGPYFITTDNPGISLGDDEKIYNTKFKGGFQFYLPLSYRYCLLMDDEIIDDSYKKKKSIKLLPHLQLPADGVISINNTVIQKADQLVIGANSEYIEALLAANRKLQPSENI